jgi:hypothetical protein
MNVTHHFRGEFSLPRTEGGETSQKPNNSTALFATKTAGPSTALRSGRDDKSKGGGTTWAAAVN